MKEMVTFYTKLIRIVLLLFGWVYMFIPSTPCALELTALPDYKCRGPGAILL